jgi:dUTP pyrophosphatase
MSEVVKIKVKKLSNDFDDIPIPYYATTGSAGMDVRAAVENMVVIEPSTIFLVPTNLSFEIPKGYEIQVRPRSGLAANHGVGILNSPGTIDSDYRGEIKIILINLGKEKFTIKRGDRIAQLVVSKVYIAKLAQSDDLTQSPRGKGGFGHTGKE